MKFNTIKNICLSGVLLIACSSCEDFLTEKPEGTVSAEQYFKPRKVMNIW